MDLQCSLFDNYRLDCGWWLDIELELHKFLDKGQYISDWNKLDWVDIHCLWHIQVDKMVVSQWSQEHTSKLQDCYFDDIESLVRKVTVNKG
jgi:transcriptional antiterminator Rof (Rho-off)